MYKKQYINDSISFSKENEKILDLKNSILSINNKNIDKSVEIKKQPNSLTNNNNRESKIVQLDSAKIEQVARINYNKHYNKLFDKTKINVVVSWCFIPEWVIMYTFYLLEQKMFDISPKNINIIPITKFTENINYNLLNRTMFNNILDKCYDNLIATLDKMNTNYKTVLYFINNVTYEPFFNKNIIQQLKKKNIKIMLWRDDLFGFSNIRMTSIKNYLQPFDSYILDSSDILLSPSIKYFENIKSKYLNKTKFFFYALDENVYFNVKFEDKINKILISGETNHFVYRRRKQLYETMNPNLFDRIRRPHNKIDTNNNRDTSNCQTRYYETMSKYKGCIMTLAEFPVDFLLGKFIEVFNANTIPIFDYTYELDKRLMLEIFDHYVPTLIRDNFIVQDEDYYRSFINNKKNFNYIISNGYSFVRNQFSLEKSRNLLYETIDNLFVPEEKNYSNCNILIDMSFEEFNLNYGFIEEIVRNKTNKIINNKPTQQKILKLNYTINGEIKNKENIINIKKILPKKTKYPNKMISTGNKLNKRIITVITNNNNQLIFAKKIAELLKLELINLSLSKEQIKTNDKIHTGISHNLKDDITYINNAITNIIFNEKYSSFIKNCGGKQTILFQLDKKKIVNRLYNPFNTREITIYKGKKMNLYEINKLVYLAYPSYNLAYNKLFNITKELLRDYIKEKDLCDKYYYFGEFGYFHTIILGTLDQYFIKNPKRMIKIMTYDGFADILKLLFPNNVMVEKIPLEQDRECHSSVLEPPFDYIDLTKAEINFHTYLHIKAKLPYISKPLDYKDSKESKINKKYIAIFARHRFGKYSKRNMHLNIFNTIESCIHNFIRKNNKNYEILLLGKKEETNPHVLKKNYKFVEDMHETIGLLRNNVDLLIAPDSGFIDFAKNCAVKNIIMVYEGNYLDYHNTFNPFKTNYQTIEYQDFHQFNSILEKCI